MERNYPIGPLTALVAVNLQPCRRRPNRVQCQISSSDLALLDVGQAPPFICGSPASYGSPPPTYAPSILITKTADRSNTTGDSHASRWNLFADLCRSCTSSWILFGFLPGAILGGVGAALIIFALISFAVTYGMWTDTKWAWWLGIIVAVLDIISIVSLNVIGLIIGLVMLYYLTRPHVKFLFHEEHNRI